MASFSHDEEIKEYLLKHREIRGECWIWKGFKDKDGYGLINVNNKSYRVNRLAYELFINKPIYDVIAHTCDTPACFNPEYLRDWTQAQNLEDALNKGRVPNRNWNTDKTHCKHGHEFTRENTYVRPDGNRDCQICRQIRREKTRWKYA